MRPQPAAPNEGEAAPAFGARTGGDASTWDVVVLGGAFSGASTAYLLRRAMPWARVLVVESAERFDHKVGEATVELSAFFLVRVLGLWDLLSREHLPKHGLRFWIPGAKGHSLGELSELGPEGQPDLPSYQLERATLDEALLARAVESGAELLRPARVVDVQVAETLGQESRVRVEAGGSERELRARWVVDATGRHGLLSKRLDLREQLAAHPTTAYWTRWQGVLDLDDPELCASTGIPLIRGSRRLATNHFTGYGYWIWAIPLKSGLTSIGLVHDQRLFELPGVGSLEPRVEAFLRNVPGLGSLLCEAHAVEGDFRTYRHLPYRARRYMGPGWALVGDAASFLDPFYSPGLDHCALSIFATVRRIEEALSHGLSPAEIERNTELHNAAFQRSYTRMFEALYRDKYEILGDVELVRAAYHLDTSLYYLGVVQPAYRDTEELLWPVLGRDQRIAEGAYRLLRFFHRRSVTHARLRRRAGAYGRRNGKLNDLSFRFALGSGAGAAFLRGLRAWLRVELSGPGMWWRARQRERAAHAPTEAPAPEGARPA